MSESLERCGPYVLLRRIGAGGMGEIFLARAPDQRTVAIKRLLAEGAQNPAFVGMFQDEARLVERMHHRHICRVFEHGRDGPHHYLVMEHVDGRTLGDLLERNGPLSVPVACRILADLASALDYAHRLEGEDGPLGIVHRDVTPSNIMINREGRVKLLDFGLAKARTQLMKTAPGLVKGKFGYLAPEQLAGRVDWRTDVFSLGLCLYEALTGEGLFNQTTAADTVRAIRAFRGPPPLSGRVPGVGPRLDAVLQRALAPQPADRYDSAAAFRAALAQVVNEGETAARAADLARIVRGDAPPEPPAERSRWPWFVLVAAGCVLAGLAAALIASS